MLRLILFYIIASSGPPSNVKVVYEDGTSIKLTWSRPNDYLTDYDYPFNYSLCISDRFTKTCDLATDNGLQYSFRGLQPLTNYSITICAQSANMSGEAFNLTASTTKTGNIRFSDLVYSCNSCCDFTCDLTSCQRLVDNLLLQTC